MLSPTDPRWRSMPDGGTPEQNAHLHEHYQLDHALAWLHEHRSLPFFLFLHTYRVHNYAPSESTVARLRAESASRLGFDDIQRLLEPDNPEVEELGADDVALLSSCYDATIAEVDADLHALFAALAQDDLLRSTIVVVTADHGEEFREHGHLFHGRTLYQEMLHVPLVIHAPACEPARIATPIGLADLAPTLLDLAGLPPMPSAQGHSLKPLLRREPLPAAPLLAEHQSTDGAAFALRFGAFKLLHSVRGHGDRNELYDLEHDPRETQDCFARDAKEAAHLRLLLAEQRRELTALRVKTVNEGNLPAELKEELRRLGY
ncbi:MAG: sulfatase-like hydrolase/transferase [Planctomycetota bacterium]